MSKISNFLYLSLHISSVLLFQTNVSDYYDEYVPRVVNGRPARLGDVPYQIAFKALKERHRIYSTFCGGVIMAPTKLLSAAHCFLYSDNLYQKLLSDNRNIRSSMKKYAVAGNLKNLGSFKSYDSNDAGQWRKLRKVVFPKTFQFPRDDIAIVLIYAPFIYNNFVNYIPIASKLVDYHGKCLVSGFGRISHKATSNKLLLVELDLIPIDKCNRMHRRNMSQFVCTSSIVTDVGKGDSGGPLVCSNTGDPNERPGKGILIGIVSGHRYGVGSFFTRVSSYYDYIQRNKSNNIFSKINIFIIIQTRIFLF